MRRLQLLLSETARTDDTRSAVVRELEALGCTVTGVGAASLSVRVSEAVYCRLFDAPARDETTLKIPVPLRHYLSSVSEAPSHQAYGSSQVVDPAPAPSEVGKGARRPRKSPSDGPTR